MRLQLNSRDVILTAGLALCAALITALTLATLSTPQEFRQRVLTLEQRTSEVRRLSNAGKGQRMRAGAICTGDAGEQTAHLRQQIAADATSLQLAVAWLDVRLMQEPAATELTGIRLQLEMSGSYEAAVALLERLDRLEPQVFADTVDLASKTTSVTISFSGRAFCSA